MTNASPPSVIRMSGSFDRTSSSIPRRIDSSDPSISTSPMRAPRSLSWNRGMPAGLSTCRSRRALFKGGSGNPRGQGSPPRRPAPSDPGQVGGGRVQEKRRQEPRILDSVGVPFVPEPEDHRVAVVVPVGVDDPAVRGRTPPTYEGSGPLERVPEGGRGEG